MQISSMLMLFLFANAGTFTGLLHFQFLIAYSMQKWHTAKTGSVEGLGTRLGDEVCLPICLFHSGARNVQTRDRVWNLIIPDLMCNVSVFQHSCSKIEYADGQTYFSHWPKTTNYWASAVSICLPYCKSGACNLHYTSTDSM